MKGALKDVGSCPQRVRHLTLKRKPFSECRYVGDCFAFATYGDETESGGTCKTLGDMPEVDDSF